MGVWLGRSLSQELLKLGIGKKKGCPLFTCTCTYIYPVYVRACTGKLNTMLEVHNGNSHDAADFWNLV